MNCCLRRCGVGTTWRGGRGRKSRRCGGRVGWRAGRGGRERIVAAMERSPQPRSAVLAALGARAVEAAWGARGGGWANTVPAEGWKVMGEELAKARALLEEAWKLDDKNFFAALTMLGVEL